MINPDDISLWKYCGLVQESLVIYRDLSVKGLSINFEPLDFISPVIFGMYAPHYPLYNFINNGLDKVGVLILMYLLYKITGNIVRLVL